MGLCAANFGVRIYLILQYIASLINVYFFFYVVAQPLQEQLAVGGVLEFAVVCDELLYLLLNELVIGLHCKRLFDALHYFL